MLASALAQPVESDRVADVVRGLEEDGAVRLDGLLPPETLREMQTAFESRLRTLRWNDCDGYERTERFRLMVQDVLTLSQGFVDLALHPLIKKVLDAYIGPHYELCEAKGWRSLPTKKDFHGWHGDAWYDRTKVGDRIPREVKAALYLTDVRSGSFQYIRGTHGRNHPTHLRRDEADQLPMDRMIDFLGPAGTVVLFDTSGIHRQGVPILEPRNAVFLNYHDPSLPLQAEDVEYYRYHPLLLNAAFLGNLASEDVRILGFGNKTHYQPDFVRTSAHRGFRKCMNGLFGAKLFLSDWRGRLWGKVKRVFGKR